MRSGPSSKKKEKQCDPANPKDQGKGDQWDATALDARSRFVLSLVIGKRTPELIQEVVDDFVGRTDGRLPQLIFTDGYRAYAPALMATYGIEVEPPKTGKVGRPRSGYLEWPCGVVYATVTKTYKQGGSAGFVES